MYKREAKTFPLGPAPMPETITNVNLLRDHYRTLWLATEKSEAVRTINRAFEINLRESRKGPAQWRDYHWKVAKTIEQVFKPHLRVDI